MGSLARHGVRRDKPLSGTVEVQVTFMALVEIGDEDGCTTRRAMGEVAEAEVKTNPHFWLLRESNKNNPCVDVEAMSCE